MAGVVEAVHKAVCGGARVGAASDVFDGLWRGHGHPLIEYKTLSLPVLRSHFTVVVHDASVELENSVEAVVPKERGRFLTSDSAGAIHENLPVTESGELVHVRREFSKVLDVALDGICKLAHRRFVTVSHVDEYNVRVAFNGGLPL